jgi:hypothetical protein
MRRSDNRQDGGPIGLLPVNRERRNSMRQPINPDPVALDDTDGWVLLAVAYADIDGRGVNLRSIRTLTTLIRHAAFANDELSAILVRLVASDLIQECGGLFHPADRVSAFLQARTFRRSVAHDHRDLLRHLRLAFLG